jgi:hypothetical protein
LRADSCCEDEKGGEWGSGGSHSTIFDAA